MLDEQWKVVNQVPGDSIFRTVVAIAAAELWPKRIRGLR